MDHLDQKHFPGNSLVVHSRLCSLLRARFNPRLGNEGKKSVARVKKRKIQNVLKEKKKQQRSRLAFQTPKSYLFGSVQEASN